MKRTLASHGFLMAIAALLVAACSKTPEQPAAKATATPAAAAIAPSPAAPGPAGQAQAPAPAEELYVDLEGDPDEGPPPLAVKWTSTVEDGTPPYTYKWDFGDGSAPASDANPTHKYEKEGEFTATLTVTDSKGLTGSEEYDILVEKEEE
jgi:PKD repeat protein